MWEIVSFSTQNVRWSFKISFNPVKYVSHSPANAKHACIVALGWPLRAMNTLSLSLPSLSLSLSHTHTHTHTHRAKKKKKKKKRLFNVGPQLKLTSCTIVKYGETFYSRHMTLTPSVVKINKLWKERNPVMSRNVSKRTFGQGRPAKIQIRLRIRAVWSESSVGAFWIEFFHADSEDSIRLWGWSCSFESLLGVHIRKHVLSRCGGFWYTSISALYYVELHTCSQSKIP